MSQLRVFHTPKFEFYLERGSGQPSNYASFFITSEDLPLDAAFSLGSSGPLEYSLDGNSWYPLEFNLAETVELTQVYVRAIADLNQSVSSGAINVGGTLIPYSITVDATPSLKVDAAASTLKVLSTRNTTGTEYAIGSVTVEAKNLDLVTTSQNQLVISVPAGFQVAFPLMGPGTQVWSQQVEWYGSLATQYIFLQVRANRNKPSNSHEICKLSYTLPGLTPVEFTSVDFGYDGAKAYVRGNLASLSGVCGEQCKPTSIVLDVISSAYSLVFTVTPSAGFKYKVSRLAPTVGFVSGLTSVYRSTTGTFSVAASVASSFQLSVILDQNVLSTAASGTITIQATSATRGFETIIVPIPASTNAKATIVPVCQWLNMVTPSEAATFTPSTKFYRQDPSQVAPVLTTQPGVVVKYAGSPYYLDPENATSENSDVVSDPITYDNLSETPPILPGRWEAVVSWDSFLDLASGVTYDGGEVKLPYTILPGSTSSEVYYGVDDFIQYTVQNRYIHGLEYSPRQNARSISFDVSKNIDDSILGVTASDATKLLFSTSSPNNAVNPVFARNPSCWAKDIDTSPISVFTDGNGVNPRYDANAMTLISPRHVVMANHYQNNIPENNWNNYNGARVVFVGMDNTSHVRTLISSAQVGDTDIRVGLLDTDLPSNVSFCEVANKELVYNYGAGGVPPNSSRKPVFFQTHFAGTDGRKALIGEYLTGSGGGSSNSITGLGIIYTPQNATRAAFYEEPETGDSGRPVAFVVDNKLVLLFNFTSSGTGTNVSEYISEINSVMASLGGGYSLTVFGEAQLIYSGTTRNGDDYLSLTPPDYPGAYTQAYYLGNVDVTFQADLGVFGVFGEGSSPHGLVNGDTLTLVEFPLGADLLFSGPVEDYEVEVIDSTRFKLKSGAEYFRCPLMGPYVFSNARVGTISSYPLFQTSSVQNPEVGNVAEYRRVYEIEQRTLVVFPQPADRLFTTLDPTSRSASFQALASDSSAISLQETIYEYSDKDTGELIVNANDWNTRKYIAKSSTLMSGTPSTFNKYSFRSEDTYQDVNIFRKHYYVSWSLTPITKEYDKNDWQDLDTLAYGITTVGGESPTTYGLNFEVSLTAFPRKDSTGGDLVSVDVGDYIGYYEITRTGDNLDNLVLYPAISKLSGISISPKTLTTESVIVTKQYDGLSEISVSTSAIALAGILSGDDVYVQSVEASVVSAESSPVVTANLGGNHSSNYQVSVQNLTANITPRVLLVDLGARKTYNGRDNSRIPLTITYSGFPEPLQAEPLCFHITSPAYGSGDVGSGKTSTDSLQFRGLNALNYIFDFGYNNSVTRFQAQSSSNVFGANPVEGTIDSLSLLVDPASLTGSKEYDGSVDAHDSVNFSFLNVQGDDELDENDIIYTATLNNANRGLRSYSLLVTELSPTSLYYGNYLISGTFSGACAVTPKPVTSQLAKSWLLFSGKTATSEQFTHTYNGANPSIIFNIPETPIGTTVYESSVARLVADSMTVVPEYFDVGEYFIRLSFTGWSNQNSFSNYKPDPLENAEYVEIPFTILKKKLIVHTASVGDATYLSSGWDSPDIAFDISGVVGADSHGVTATGVYVSTSGVYVPQSKVDLSFSTTNSNYEIDAANSTPFVYGKVSPKVISVSSVLISGSNEKVYDGSRQAVLTYTGITPGQPPNLLGVATPDLAFVSIAPASAAETFYASANAGIRTISCSYFLTGTRAANYLLELTTYPGTINPKTISFTGLYGVSKVFDGNEVSSLSPENFSYTGIVPQDIGEYAGTPVGNLSAYFTTFNAGVNKEVRLVGLQPPTPNYYIQDSEEGWLVLPESNSTPYEIFKRPLSLKPKGISKYFGEILATPQLNVAAEEFETIGLIEENFLNAVDPLTGKHFGDKLLKATRYINEGAAREDSTGIYVGVVYAANPVLDRGNLNNYELTTGATSSSYRGILVIIDASFKGLTLAIKEAIWAKECASFGCRELNWFDLITSPNRKITIVDFANSDPQHDTGDYVKIEQSLADAEVLVTE